MNTNDFSVCNVGDKLWSIQLGECEVTDLYPSFVILKNTSDETEDYYYDGKLYEDDKHQSLFFSNPNIVAPARKEIIYKYQWLVRSLHNLTLYNITGNYKTQEEALSRWDGWEIVRRIEESKTEVK